MAAADYVQVEAPARRRPCAYLRYASFIDGGSTIGLHGGWIFWLKSYGVVTTPLAGANVWLLGTEKLTDGWLALPLLLATSVIVALIPVQKREGAA